MPYWRHAKDHDYISGQPFGTMVEARDGIDPKLETVTFVATEDENWEWYKREQDRFLAGDYIVVPWIADKNMLWSSYDYPDSRHKHYPHLSLSHAGLIAYTKSDEHGVNDRQTRVSPGKYLTEFYADIFTPAQIAEYANRCTAATSAEPLQIARSEADIVAIYSTHGSIRSCMELYGSDEYTWRQAVLDGYRKHPVAVYGDSDLGVAYLGDIATKITARAVVWPDKKRYVRVYGDLTLGHALNAAGYHKTDDLDGARIRKIHSGQGIIMPYVDGHEYAGDGESGWIVLGEEDDYRCNYVTGYARSGQEDDSANEDSDDDEDMCECEHCNRHYSYGSQENGDLNRSYCDDCLESRSHCDHCDVDSWQDTSEVGNESWCESCVVAEQRTCEHLVISNDNGHGLIECGEQWIEQGEFSVAETALRCALRTSHLCRKCADGKQQCQHCEALFADEAMQCAECGHAIRCDKTSTLPEFEQRHIPPCNGACCDLTVELPF